MQREIKFRAWDTKTKTMWNKAGIDAHSNKCYAEKSMNGTIMKQFDDLHIEKFDIYYPDDIVLMQYTGLKDKNGVEIYEGDIIQYSNENSPTKDGIIKGYVFFERGKFIVVRTQTGKEHLSAHPLHSYCKSHIIVGNIYQSKHLLGNTDTKA